LKKVRMFKIEWTQKALRQLNKLEPAISIRIIKKIDELINNFHHLDIKRLKNIELFRLRVGDYRVIFDIQKDIIFILKVGHRKNIYKN